MQEIKGKLSEMLSEEKMTEEQMGEFLFLTVLMAKKNGFDGENLLAEYNKDIIRKILEENGQYDGNY